LESVASTSFYVVIYICVTNSLALITDSTHALLDAVVTAILIIAVRLALKPKDVYDCHLVLSLL
jgi:Co/Zn/Cd efflux system component